MFILDVVLGCPRCLRDASEKKEEMSPRCRKKTLPEMNRKGFFEVLYNGGPLAALTYANSMKQDFNDFQDDFAS